MIVSAQAIDSVLLKAVGEAALGMNVSAHWNADFDNAANQRFVESFVRKYNREPSIYANEGYDAGLAIAAALRENGGKFGDAEIVSASHAESQV